MSAGRNETEFYPVAPANPERHDLSSYEEPSASDSPAAIARNIIQFRRRREALLGAALFADPAWDMLLYLLIAEENGQQTPVISLCRAAAVPTTTALRWIGALAEAGFVQRERHPEDRRVAFVRLTPDASSRVRALLAER